MFPERFTRCLLFAALTLMAHFLPQIPAQKSGGQRWLIGDRDSHCGILCSKNTGKPVCGSDGRSYDNNCDLLRAKCKDRTLSLAHRGRCKGKNWSDQSPVLTFPTSASEGKELEYKDSSQPKCHMERSAAQELAKKGPQESIFIPECNDDGTFAQVQCHTLTGYCWCVTTDGKPVSGSSVHNKTPVCSGNFGEFIGTHPGKSEQTGSSTDKPPGPSNSGKKDDGSKPTPTMETHLGQNPEGYLPEHKTPTIQNWQVFAIDKQNNSSIRRPDKIQSCDRERQSALEEAQLNPLTPVFIPDCGPQGLYKPVQCHQSTGYCWCVLVDTGRPIRGTSARYKKPECNSTASSRGSNMEDPFRERDLAGCPDGKKVEFITSLMDALTTDMVQAINSPSPPGGGRFKEPDPNHTLEERVVQWYFAQLDNNDSDDISKKEIKPFKRYVKKKAKPKRCARKFTEYCDLDKNKSITLQELKGCLGVSKEGTTASSSSNSQGTRQGTNLFIGRLA